MIVEHRQKQFPGNPWFPVQADTKFEDLNMSYYSVRINKDRQYHRPDTPGFKEAYNKAITWMKLTGQYDDVWSHW